MKKVILAMTIIALSLGATSVYAATTTYPTIIQRLMQKFGLKEADVKSVFDEAHKDRLAQMLARQEERLTQEVKDGKISETQKTVILAKLKELQASREKSWQDVQSWAEQNKVDLRYLGGGRGMKGHMMKHW